MFDMDLMRRLGGVVALTETEASSSRAYREPDDGGGQGHERAASHVVPLLKPHEIAGLVSLEAKTTVVCFEVTSQQHYEAKLVTPEWPGGDSGVTIGIGYDVGYHTLQELQEHWGGVIGDGDIALLSKAVGLKGQAAQAVVAGQRGVRVPWDAAMQAYTRSTMPKYGQLVLETFPNAVELAGHSFGALFSLVFNRGAKLEGERRIEMRRIRDLMAEKKFADVPAQIRAMKRLWVDTNLTGLLKRREAEALLFERGLELRSVAVASAEGQLERVSDERFYDGDGLYFDDESASFDASFEKSGSASEVKWPSSDDDAPDYHHIQSRDRKLSGSTFELGVDELELLIKANSFEPTRQFGRIIFALRGAELVTSLTSPTVVSKQVDRTRLTLRDTRPNHRDFRCVIGVYDTTTNRLSGFAASTVPNVKAVTAYYTNKTAGNMTPTGCYRFEVGWHLQSKPERKVPGCLVERGRRKAVIRSTNDLTYELTDSWHNERDTGNNLHPAYGTTEFSSFGCLVVRGTFNAPGDRVNGRHQGEWAEFRSAMGFVPTGTADHGKEFDVVVLTGLEGAVAFDLIKSGQWREAGAVSSRLVRLRQGSKGPAVAALQRALGLPATAVFDHGLAKAFADRQKKDFGGKSDGIYSADLDRHYGFRIFEESGPTVASLEGVRSLGHERVGGGGGDSDLDVLYYEIGLAAEAYRRNTASGASFESIGSGQALERISLDLGFAGLKSMGKSLALTVERQLQGVLCGGSMGQLVDRDAIRSKVDAAAQQGVGELRRYLSGLLSTLTLLPPTVTEKIVDIIFERFVLPATMNLGPVVTSKLDLSAAWLCEQWGCTLGLPAGSVLPDATAPQTKVPTGEAAAPKDVTGPVSDALTTVQNQADPVIGSEASAMLERIERAAKGSRPDVEGVRHLIHELRAYLDRASVGLTADESKRFVSILCDSRFMEQIAGTNGVSPYDLIAAIDTEVREAKKRPLNRKALSRLIYDLNLVLQDARVALQPVVVAQVLQTLRKVKAFDDLSLIADRLIARDPSMLGLVATKYAQGLIDSGRLRAGIEVLNAALRAGSMTKEETSEANGLLGRAHKQIYVNHVRSQSDAVALNEAFSPVLSAAIDYYGRDYDPQRPGENYYQGINYIALLKLAERHGGSVAARGEVDALARNMIGALEPVAAVKDDPWLLATLGEANLAVGNLDKAADYYGRYAQHTNVDLFQLNGSVRQLEEIWGLKAAADGPGAILMNLKGVLARLEQGQVSLDLPERQALKRAEGIQFHEYFERNLPGGQFVNLYVLKKIVECGAAVAAIQMPMGQSAQTIGTGFLVRGSDFSRDLSDDKSYILTNAHVLWDPSLGLGVENDALSPDRAQIIFETDLIDGRREIYRCSVVWQSPSTLHDATLVELDRKVTHIAPLSIARPEKKLTIDDGGAKGSRLAVLGHPKGGNLSVGVMGALDGRQGTLVDRGGKGNAADPIFLHYRTPTEPGNSGSPVFDFEDWLVVALHHAGFKDQGLPRLSGKAGTHEANEGICIQSIRTAIEAWLRQNGKKKRRLFSRS